MMRRTAMLGLVALIIAACSPDSGEDTTTSEGPTTTEAAGATTVETDPATTMADTTTTVLEAGGDDNCVEGSWDLDTDSFIDTMTSMFSTEGFEGTVSANDGGYIVNFDSDGSFTAERVDWGFVVDTPDGVFSLTVNGTDSGTWSADGSTMTVAITSSDAVSQATVTVDGEELTMPQSPIEPPEALAESSMYSCDGDMLTVVTEDVEIVMNRR